MRKANRDPASKKLKAPLKRTAKRTEPHESSQPQAPEHPQYPKPRVSCNTAPERKTKTAGVLKNTVESELPGTKKKQKNQGQKKNNVRGNTHQQTNRPEEETANKSGPSNRLKEEVRQMEVSIFTTLIFLYFK